MKKRMMIGEMSGATRTIGKSGKYGDPPSCFGVNTVSFR